MKNRKLPMLKHLTLISISIIAFSCSNDTKDGTNGKDGVNGQDGQNGKDAELILDNAMFSNKSIVEPLVKIDPAFPNVRAYSLVSTVDVIGENKFQLASTVDGAGLIKDDGNGFIYVVNCEDSYAIARLRLDNNLNPIKGDYLLNSGVADYSRQCSGTMWEKEIHGGDKDVFLSASEEEISNVVKEMDPRVVTPNPTGSYGNPALGRFLWENALPLPKDTYPGKTVILGGDDAADGQVILYYSENGDVDRTNGKVYVLRFKEVSDGPDGKKKAVDPNVKYTEDALDLKVTYDIEFVEVVDAKNKSERETSLACTALNASAFIRMEDIDYQKGSAANARNLFFNVTGRGPGSGSVNDWGTVYKLELDANSPLKGKLTQIVSGNVTTNKKNGNLASLQSPDGICVTENFVYIQEDPNSFAKGHAAYIYQSDLNGNNIKKFLDLKIDHNLASNSTTIDDSGEFGSMVDISDKVGVPGTFLLAVQAKYWQSDKFKGLDGHIHPIKENDRASQIVILRNVPR
ncbi:hypothetical protein [Flavobacterium sp.]|uniref:hypothetical protein n=1 Tax=Flavobacterium sp. TaxID=239 RepID=UPI003C5451E2